jgi:hypothetical protein
MDPYTACANAAGHNPQMVRTDTARQIHFRVTQLLMILFDPEDKSALILPPEKVN